MIVTVFASVLIFAMLAVIYFDATRFIIPNWLNAALILLFPLWWYLSPTPIDALGSLYLFLAFLVVGFALFALGLMGAGDVKLLAALALYIGWNITALYFLIYMGLIGGALTMLILIIRRILRSRETKPRIFTRKEPVPYGLAIAGSFLFLLIAGRMAGFAEFNLIRLL